MGEAFTRRPADERCAGAAGSWETRVDYTAPVKLNRLQLTNPVFAHFQECFGGPSQNFNQGWYDNGIAVDPKDESIVWTAGVDLMRSDDGGANWGVASYWWFDDTDPNYSHADQHAITFHPKYNGDSNRQMFVASDGGIHRTDDARAAVGTTVAAVCGNPVPNAVTWTALNNGYQVTQFYHERQYELVAAQPVPAIANRFVGDLSERPEPRLCRRSKSRHDNVRPHLHDECRDDGYIGDGMAVSAAAAGIRLVDRS